MSIPSVNKILAIATANIKRHCDVASGRVVAMAFSGEYLIAVATSKRIRDDSSSEPDKEKWTIHAEEFLLNKLQKIKASSRFKSITIVVLRFTANGGLSMALPCNECQKIIKKNKWIDKIHYSDWNGDIKIWNR